MLKYIKHHMETIAGIEIFPVISLCIFFLFFMLLFWRVFRMNKESLEALKQQPFE